MRREPLFQFTPLREGRRAAARHYPTMTPISIHAPAGGATAEQAKMREYYNVFQFTPLREGRRA